MAQNNPEILSALAENYRNALTRFEASLRMEKDEEFFYLDAAIHRFMICYELTWKGMRRILKARQVQVNSPVMTFRAAYAEGMIHDKALFEQMIIDRNVATHEYYFERAVEVYSRLSGYHAAFMHFADAFPELLKDQGTLG